MPPLSSRNFQKAAAQRLTTAEFLLKSKFTLDAMYLAGYAVECSLKALILELTAETDKPKIHKKITAGRKMHEPEILGGILKDLGCAIALELVQRFRRAAWSTALRYETGRKDTGETRAFLRTAKMTLDWVEEKLP